MISTPSIWLGLAGTLLAWGFAAYVWRVAPRSRVTGYLVALLLIDGLTVITASIGTDFWTGTGLICMWAMLVVYLRFIGVALNSRLVSLLKRRSVQAGILAIALIIPLMFILFLTYAWPLLFVIRLAPVLIVVSLAWGFVAAIHTWVTTSNPAKRSQARSFATAFGVRDVSLALYVYVAFRFSYSWPFWDAYGHYVYYSGIILYIPLLAYGVLRTHLFDIDLRVKKTLQTSIIAATFITAYFLVSEFAALLLSERFGNVLGLLCTGGLIFLLDPIQRAAQKFSDAAMPNTHATPQYESYRKLQVYEAAVQSALEDGDITDRERRMLRSLVKSLGIEPKAAERLETDLRTSISESL